MEKQTLLLMAGGILALASCNNEQAADAGMNQAQVDSAVNARVEEIRAELMAQNDSLINALAQWKADSIIAAMKGTASASAKPKPTTKPSTSKPTTPTVKPNTPTGKNSQSQQTDGKPTGKNSESQQTDGKPTGKRSQQQSQ